MDRRDFLKKGALASGLVAASGAVLPSDLRGAASRPLPDMDKYLGTIDAGIERIGGWSITSAFPNFQGDRELYDSLARGSMQSLYLTGMFGDLPLEGQFHPGMQDRMWAHQSTMDQASDGVRDLLASQTPADLNRIRSVLRADPNVRVDITNAIDAEVARSGVSDARRRQTRALFDQVGWRMTYQPPGLLVEEYLGKVDRVSASDVELEARRQWLASKINEKAFWAYQEERSLRERRISSGQHKMGLGVIIFGASVLLAVLADDSGDGDLDGLLAIGLVGATVGSVLFVIGLFQLLIGAATSEEAA